MVANEELTANDAVKGTFAAYDAVVANDDDVAVNEEFALVAKEELTANDDVAGTFAAYDAVVAKDADTVVPAVIANDEVVAYDALVTAPTGTKLLATTCTGVSVMTIWTISLIILP